MKKLTVVILSDPKQGEDEALGRLFNGLVVAYDAKMRGDDVEVIFQGAGTRWPEWITQKSHPANSLYEAVKDRIAGISCACADVFGARESAKSSGFDLISECKVPGTSGLPSIANRLGEGNHVVTF